MKKILLLSFVILLGLVTEAQQISVADLQPDGDFENVTSKKVYGDSLATTFVIWVKHDVKLHKHALHTEQVLVLDGTASMRTGDVWRDIKKGDLIVIPAGTPHAVKVTSADPLKVLSIQSPMFDGSDRIMIEEN